jgi:hypothetical protein
VLHAKPIAGADTWPEQKAPPGGRSLSGRAHRQQLRATHQIGASRPCGVFLFESRLQRIRGSVGPHARRRPRSPPARQSCSAPRESSPRRTLWFGPRRKCAGLVATLGRRRAVDSVQIAARCCLKVGFASLPSSTASLRIIIRRRALARCPSVRGENRTRSPVIAISPIEVADRRGDLVLPTSLSKYSLEAPAFSSSSHRFCRAPRTGS